MILRLAWLSALLFAAAVIFFSAIIGGVWLWGIATSPSMREARAIRDRLLEREIPAAEIFPGDWQALCIAGPYAVPVDVIAKGTELAQTPCDGWDEDWQAQEMMTGLLLVSGRGCRAVPVRRDIFDAALLGGQCFTRASRPMLSLISRGSPPRQFLQIR